jgi:hypothetical protein
MARVAGDGAGGGLTPRLASAQTVSGEVLVKALRQGAAFPLKTAGRSDGETLVFHADGVEGRTLVARIKIAQWSTQQP